MGGRPQSGYRNAAGDIVPATHHITDRYGPKDGLMGWLYNRGKDGKPRWGTDEIDIGKVTHEMAEMDMRGATLDDIDGFLDRTVMPYADKQVCVKLFAQYRSWRTSFSIRPVLQEKPLVSEEFQYGGTPDLIGLTPQGFALVDLKTSSQGQPYLDMLIAMAAHGHLWNEHQLNVAGEDAHCIECYHLLLLPKDGSPFKCLSYTAAHIEPYWQLFQIWRSAYDLDKACSTAAALVGERLPGEARQPKPKRAAKPQKPPVERIPYQPQVPMSMAEILRSYGHVRANA